MSLVSYVSRQVCMASADEICGFGRHVLVHHVVCGVVCTAMCECHVCGFKARHPYWRKTCNIYVWYVRQVRTVVVVLGKIFS